ILRPGHQERFEPLDSRRQLVLLNGAGRIHVLGTNLGALSHERASPDSLMLGQHEGIWGCTFVGECTQVCPKHVDPAGAIQQYKLTATIERFKSFLMPRGAK